MSEVIRKVIIDTDAGWDDWIAISLLAKNENIEIVGIVVSGCGEAYLQQGTENIGKLLTLLGKTDIPLCRGHNAPFSTANTRDTDQYVNLTLPYANVFPATFRKDITNVYGYPELPASEVTIDTRPAVEFLTDIIGSNPGEYSFLCIGGLTTFANYIRSIGSDPTKFPKFQQIVVMGGSFSKVQGIDYIGNIQDLFNEAYPTNEVAEWNIFIDIFAAQYCLDHYSAKNGLQNQIILVPLDVCRTVPLTQDIVNTFKNNPTKDKVATFISFVLEHKFEEAKVGGYIEYFYDPLAASTIIDETAHSITKCDISVRPDFNEENDVSGQTIPDLTKASHGYASQIDSGAFYKLMTDTFLASSSS